MKEINAWLAGGRRKRRTGGEYNSHPLQRLINALFQELRAPSEEEEAEPFTPAEAGAVRGFLEKGEELLRAVARDGDSCLSSDIAARNLQRPFPLGAAAGKPSRLPSKVVKALVRATASSVRRFDQALKDNDVLSERDARRRVAPPAGLDVGESVPDGNCLLHTFGQLFQGDHNPFFEDHLKLRRFLVG